MTTTVDRGRYLAHWHEHVKMLVRLESNLICTSTGGDVASNLESKQLAVEVANIKQRLYEIVDRSADLDPEFK